MHHHLFLERIAQQEHIPVCLHIFPGHLQAIHPPEKLRSLPPHRQPVRILPDVVENDVERAPRVDYLVIKASLKNLLIALILIDRNLESSYLIAKSEGQALMHPEQNMNMIRHNHILVYLNGAVSLR